MPTTINIPTARLNPNDRHRRGRRRSFAGHSSTHPLPPAKLLMENVKILKRGEPLTPFLPKTSHLCTDMGPRTAPARSAAGDLSLGSTNRLGPDPETVKKELPVSVPGKAYATGGYFTSPHPSLVPVPGFLSGAAREGAEIATHGLRRLLGICLA